MKKILLIEDDETFSVLLTAYFRTAGYVTVRVASARDGLQYLSTSGWVAIIVDLTLPDEDGLVLIRMLRARTMVPIIVVTGRHAREDRLAALEIGADDFILKPFEPQELVLRLNNLARRSGRQDGTDRTHLPIAGGVLDIAGHTLVSPSGQMLELAAKDYRLVRLLALNPNRVITRAQIIDAIAGSEPPDSERAIDIRISRLRKRFAMIGLKPEDLRTVHGSGYKLAS
ncbi:response regulator transcription factor [Agrobacterium leguminum]|uniref:Uncharacterized protein n=1 Tax=Agrobacterium deltaense NCPPB 1641 TaxID=1183425 RepID=A0A1S7TIC4_9HYPH|nr:MULTISPECIES: response regulator transcription factor [Agrobacterium]WFS65098.1 response regulator transcription factor [Agrobacterium leguminum]CVI54354.1 conserved hypothetical protein [Agrobacterium deltaense NCPPB 1641]